ncbi:MAG: hypothetical protein WEC84_05030 [Candidatus Andersenbacteria bacterium]
MNANTRIIYILAGTFAVSVAIFALSLLPVGARSYGVVENIDGIPFPAIDGATHISEKLAHVDVYLKEPVVFKRLVMTVEFDPKDLVQLEVGVREGEFWLSYPRHALAVAGSGGRQSVTIPIQLSDKLQDTDRSIDVMFFATAEGASAKEDEGVDDAAQWELYALDFRTEFVVPTASELKDYMRSIVKRERPL